MKKSSHAKVKEQDKNNSETLHKASFISRCVQPETICWGAMVDRRIKLCTVKATKTDVAQVRGMYILSSRVDGEGRFATGVDHRLAKDESFFWIHGWVLTGRGSTMDKLRAWINDEDEQRLIHILWANNFNLFRPKHNTCQGDIVDIERFGGWGLRNPRLLFQSSN